MSIKIKSLCCKLFYSGLSLKKKKVLYKWRMNSLGNSHDCEKGNTNIIAKALLRLAVDSGVLSILVQIRNVHIEFMLQSDLGAHKFYSRWKLAGSFASRAWLTFSNCSQAFSRQDQIIMKSKVKCPKCTWFGNLVLSITAFPPQICSWCATVFANTNIASVSVVLFRTFSNSTVFLGKILTLLTSMNILKVMKKTQQGFIAFPPSIPLLCISLKLLWYEEVYHFIADTCCLQRSRPTIKKEKTKSPEVFSFITSLFHSPVHS